MKRGQGFTIIEVIIAVAIFTLVSVAFYQAFYVVMTIIKSSQARTTAMLLANEQIEIVRNLPYQDVGLLGGVPAGNIDRYKTLVRNGMTFNLQFYIRNVDDPFDGLLGSSTHNDLAPADYKLLEVEVGCPGCEHFSTTSVVTTIAPKNLEGLSNNGALFIKVFDAAGLPIPQARVKIVNASTSPTINIDETTDNTGTFALVDAPPSGMSYQLTVTKDGYSTARTYAVGGVANPNPIDRHATISSAQVTQKSLAIDRLGQLTVRTVNNICQPVPNLSFNLAGTKLIGLAPDVLKYPTTTQVTDGSGQKVLTGMEWDSYYFSLASSAYDLAGLMPLLPVAFAPAANQVVTLVMAERVPSALLVTVKDSSGLPIDNAAVTLTRSGFSATRLTNRGFVGQTSWTAGGGQVVMADENKFFSADEEIEVSQLGHLQLASTSGAYATAGELTSSSFDTGSSSTVYDSITWGPSSQSASTTVRFQLATSDDPATTTWDFVGPDGTAASYFTATEAKVPASLGGKRFLRFRAYLGTTNSVFTPILDDVAITFSSECTPFGQVLFSGLSVGTYTLSVSREGYNNYTSSAFSVGSDWQAKSVIMTAE
jgi:prepilin-type N-terminal cleavage/methylation domain-containing protein